jgi:hypothetical protein
MTRRVFLNPARVKRRFIAKTRQTRTIMVSTVRMINNGKCKNRLGILREIGTTICPIQVL